MESRQGLIRIQATDPAEIYCQIGLINELSLGVEIRDFMLPSLLDDEEDLKKWIHAYRLVLQDNRHRSIHGPVFDLNLGSIDEKLREVSVSRYIQSILIAHELEADILIFHSGHDPRFTAARFDSSLKRVLEGWERVLETVALTTKRMKICIENSPQESLVYYWKLVNAVRNRFDTSLFFACIDFDHLREEEKKFFSDCIEREEVIYVHYPLGLFTRDVYKLIARSGHIKAICVEGGFTGSVLLYLGQLLSEPGLKDSEPA